MKCTILGCPGEYEHRLVTKSFKHKTQIIVLDEIPADICSVCGDVLIHPETFNRIQTMLTNGHDPDGSVPMYKYA
jgi:YgiT-type zinc finger domain-containing protein